MEVGNSRPCGVRCSNKTGRTPRNFGTSHTYSQGWLTRLVPDWWLGCSFDVSSAESQQEGFTIVGW